MPLAEALFALSLQAPIVAPRVELTTPPPARIQIAESWDDLNHDQRERAMRNYQQYMRLPDDKRRNIDQRYEKWKKMPRDDRDRARKKHRDRFGDD